MTWIAEERVIWVLPSGERREGRIAIGAPEPDPDPDVEGDTTWKCEVALEGLWPKTRKICGDESFQPLMLALKAIGYEVHALISRGGRVAMPPGEVGDADDWHPLLMSLRELLRGPRDPYPADPVLADLDADIARVGRNEEPA
jgi:hypothetical protein